MDSFLLQATIYLAAAVIAVPVAKRVGLGSVLGYLIAGVIIGPALGLVGTETQDLQHFAEFGVVMMLFIVGLELEPKSLWDMRTRLFGLGGLQITLTSALLMGVFMTLGIAWSIALAIGLSFALSSTAIVVQTLNEKDLMKTPGGRSAFSVLLAQDIAVIPMLALVPLLAVQNIYNWQSSGASEHGHTISLIAGLPGWGATLVTVGAIAIVILGGTYLTRPIFRFIARSRLREMFTAIALLLVVGIALLMTLVGLSPALGTFLAGVVLANSEFRHELEANIEPFKGLLLGLFFITVGAGIDFAILAEDPLYIVGLALIVMLIKASVLGFLTIVFPLRGRDRWLFILSLAQAGEFGFVMLSTTISTNVIPNSLYPSLTLVIALSMMLTPILFIIADKISERSTEEQEEHDHDHIDETGPIIIVGIGRFGQIINRMALAMELKTVVIDHQIAQIDQMRRFGVKGYFGDPTRPEMLMAAGLMDAEILIVAIDDQEATIKLIEHARRARPDLHIIARAYDRNHTYRLYRAGANDIVREYFDSAIRAGRYMLEQLGWPDLDAHYAAREFFHADRNALRELASLWDPNVPTMRNTAYVERAKEINSEVYTGFLANLSQIVEVAEKEEATSDKSDISPLRD